MLIDWFTVVAQLINFLILVWLLKRFLYRPILDAIDARESRIAAELADADARKVEARRERDEFEAKNTAFEQQRATLLGQATEEAKAERQRLLDEARQAADDLSAKRMQGLRNDSRGLNQALLRRTQEEVFAIARKALADLADADLEASIAKTFTRRLGELDGETKALLAQAMQTTAEPAVVRSAFDLSEEQRGTIRGALNETFATEATIQFETAPDRISGIELSANGQKLAWSIAEYLAALEQDVAELLKAQIKAEAEPEPATPKSAPEQAPQADGS